MNNQRKIYWKKHYEKNKESYKVKHKKYHQRPEVREHERERSRTNPKSRYSTYKAGAKQRGHSFNLTFDEFMTFWQKPCHYCKDLISTIGLDRIDNNLGYILNNLISCCSDCNYARGDIFTYDEMVNMIGPAIANVKAQRGRAGTRTQ